MAWVYVVQNAEGRFYIGMTTDLEQRLIDHNTGLSTLDQAPWPMETCLEPKL
jgi:predicted GIY-YIG superfamily endonuclease